MMKCLVLILFINTTALLAQSEDWVFLRTEPDVLDSTLVVDFYIDINSVKKLGNGVTELTYKGVSSPPQYDLFDGRYAETYIEEIVFICGKKFYKRNKLKMLYTDGSEYTVPDRFNVEKQIYYDTIIEYIYELYCIK